MERKIRRGDIYYADLDPAIGSEQDGYRPVLIVQNNIGNVYSPTIIVTPITGELNKNPLPTHVLLSSAYGLEKDSLALVEQVRTIDRSRLGYYVGQVDITAMIKIESALFMCFDIKHEKKTPLFLSLCSRCESDFRDSGHILVKKDWQDKKEICDFCNTRKGLIFGVFNEGGI